MQSHTKHISDTSVELNIVAESAELVKIKNDVLKHLSHNVKVAGFRKGQVPMSMVEKSLNQDMLQSEFLEQAINDLYIDAASQANLRPVAQPKIELKKFVPFATLEFTATVEVIGQITLPDYKKFRLARPVVKVLATDVTEVLNNLSTNAAEKKPVERAAKLGDEATIDFEGTDVEKNEPVSGAKGEDYPLSLGSGAFIPGFEDNVVGLKAGDEKTFEITFPADYGVPALQSRKVSFAIKVKLVNELVKAKLDDEFAAKVGPFKTLDDLKADIKKQLEQEKSQQVDRDYNNDIITKLAEKTKVKIPDSVIEDEIGSMDRDERQNLVYRGQTWEEHLQQEGVTEEEHHERNKPMAEERVKAGLMLAEIAEKEGIEITDNEVNARVELLKSQYSDPKMQDELDDPKNRRTVVSRLMTEKTVTLLREIAGKKA